MPDPDSPPGPDGCAPPVLQQFTSQITSALTPALTCPFSPGLVSTASDLVLTALTTRLVDDPVVARRLLNQILPAGGLDPQVPASELGGGRDHCSACMPCHAC